jgi:hypothetical protein
LKSKTVIVVVSLGLSLLFPSGGRDANLSHSAKHQLKMDLFGRFLNLVTSSRLKWIHDCNPDGTGHIYKIITVHEHGRAVRIKDELIRHGGRGFGDPREPSSPPAAGGWRRRERLPPGTSAGGPESRRRDFQTA